MYGLDKVLHTTGLASAEGTSCKSRRAPACSKVFLLKPFWGICNVASQVPDYYHCRQWVAKMKKFFFDCTTGSFFLEGCKRSGETEVAVLPRLFRAVWSEVSADRFRHGSRYYLLAGTRIISLSLLKKTQFSTLAGTIATLLCNAKMRRGTWKDHGCLARPYLHPWMLFKCPPLERPKNDILKAGITSSLLTIAVGQQKSSSFFAAIWETRTWFTNISKTVVSSVFFWKFTLEKRNDPSCC